MVLEQLNKYQFTECFSSDNHVGTGGTGGGCGGAEVQGRRDALLARQLWQPPHPAHLLPQPVPGRGLGARPGARRQWLVTGDRVELGQLHPAFPLARPPSPSPNLKAAGYASTEMTAECCAWGCNRYASHTSASAYMHLCTYGPPFWMTASEEAFMCVPQIVCSISSIIHRLNILDVNSTRGAGESVCDGTDGSKSGGGSDAAGTSRRYPGRRGGRSTHCGGALCQ